MSRKRIHAVSEPLSEAEVQIYRDRLLALRASLAGAIDGLERGALEPSGGARFQDVDESIEEASLEVDLGTLAAEDEIGYEVVEALDRAAEGRLGLCESCGDWIERARLHLVPYARECAGCARSHQTSGG
jgi:RNA polymerase-binding transcription factor DksA